MRKALLFPFLFLTWFAVSGASCVTLQDITGTISSITQPVSVNTEYEVEAAVYAVRRTAYGYFALRQCRRSEVSSITNPCGHYSVKVKIQQADNRLRVALNTWRANPTALTGIRAAISNFQNVLTTEGVN